MLLLLGEEGVKPLSHSRDGDHVGVGYDGVEGGAAVLGRVSGQVLGISDNRERELVLRCERRTGQAEHQQRPDGQNQNGQ